MQNSKFKIIFNFNESACGGVKAPLIQHVALVSLKAAPTSSSMEQSLAGAEKSAEYEQSQSKMLAYFDS